MTVQVDYDINIKDALTNYISTLDMATETGMKYMNAFLTQWITFTDLSWIQDSQGFQPETLFSREKFLSDVVGARVLVSKLDSVLKNESRRSTLFVDSGIYALIVANFLCATNPLHLQDDDTGLISRALHAFSERGVLGIRAHCYIQSCLPGPLYHLLEVKLRSKTRVDVFELFHESIFYRMQLTTYEGAKTVMALSSEICRDVCFMRRLESYGLGGDFLNDFIYMIIDLGMFCYHRKCVPTINTQTQRYLREARRHPISLQQLCRRSIRGCLKDVRIMRDCYTFDISNRMKWYISLKFLNPKIAVFYTPTFPFPQCPYNSKREVQRRFTIDHE